MLGVESTFVGRCGGDMSAVTVYVAVPATPGCNDGFMDIPSLVTARAYWPDSIGA